VNSLRAAFHLAVAVILAALPLGSPVARAKTPAEDPVVETSAGPVAGSAAGPGASASSSASASATAGTRASTSAVVAFKGIPYAAPPVGPLRWRPPQPPARWASVRDSTHFGDDCMQTPYVISTGRKASEDCLTVSVWTAAHYRNAHRPVMVFVYGGAFIGGSSAYPLYDGAKLASEGVVVVGFNYRVGIFGFLAHPMLSAESPRHVSGNYGLLDQIAALQWVKSNIAAFGGDPERVTVFGESAGAVSIAVLMTSPLAKGLFQRAILQSPTLPPLAGLAAAEQRGAALKPDVEALRQLSAVELLEHNGDFFPRSAGRNAGSLAFPAPIVDGYIVPVQPRSAFQAGRVNAVPTIVGVNADEGRMFASDAAMSTALGDVFVESARLIARGTAKLQPRTFAYVFTRTVGGGTQPPTHSEELAFVFGSLEQPSFIKHPPPTAADQQLSALMMRTWTRFAASGDPNGSGLPRWPRYERAKDPYLEFGTPIRPGRAYRKAQVDVVEATYSGRE
jgi:carboxylesterase type B